MGQLMGLPFLWQILPSWRQRFRNLPGSKPNLITACKMAVMPFEYIAALSYRCLMKRKTVQLSAFLGALLVLLFNATMSIAANNPSGAVITSNGEEVAQEVIARVVEQSEKLWHRKLSKPIKLNYKVNHPETERRWPTSWGPGATSFGLGIQAGFDLPSSWWNMEKGQSAALAASSLRQKYILAIAHEITHIFMYPSPLRPWFQESVAMNLGREIGKAIDPKIGELYPSQVLNVKPQSLFGYSYEKISHSLDDCRELQRKSFFLASRFTSAQLVSWVETFRKESYDPLKESRPDAVIDQELISAMPTK